MSVPSKSTTNGGGLVCGVFGAGGMITRNQKVGRDYRRAVRLKSQIWALSARSSKTFSRSPKFCRHRFGRPAWRIEIQGTPGTAQGRFN
jgi:hypothetical protein